MSGYYLPNPHYAPDLDLEVIEVQEAYERARDEAFPYFAEATKDALQAFTDRVVYLQAYKPSPRWERERSAAKLRYSEATKDARELMERTINCIMETGEISQELDLAWGALTPKVRIIQVGDHTAERSVV